MGAFFCGVSNLFMFEFFTAYRACSTSDSRISGPNHSSQLTDLLASLWSSKTNCTKFFHVLHRSIIDQFSFLFQGWYGCFLCGVSNLFTFLWKLTESSKACRDSAPWRTAVSLVFFSLSALFFNYVILFVILSCCRWVLRFFYSSYDRFSQI